MAAPTAVAALPPIGEATRAYEAWLGRRISLVAADLAYKHEQMAAAPFPFLRATFYRWAQQFPVRCRELQSAPRVLAVGDVHTENFGTWRDAEGRLVWGVNDVDEAWPLPYANDLVRLVVSARLSIESGVLRLTGRRAAAEVLAGYRAHLQRGGAPFVLAEEHPVLRAEATSDLRNPVLFWRRFRALPAARRPPRDAVRLLEEAMPETDHRSLATRRAGLGSLGHPRLVAWGTHRGGLVAREAKRMAPSACAWQSGARAPLPLHYDVLLRGAVRCPDPLLMPHGDWLVRRLAPDCTRIEFVTVRTKTDQAELLRAMGAEVANLHLGASARRVAEVLRDLDARPADWLHRAARSMEAATLADFNEWRRTSGQTLQHRQ